MGGTEQQRIQNKEKQIVSQKPVRYCQVCQCLMTEVLEEEQESVFEEIIPENFLYLVENINIYIQRVS